MPTRALIPEQKDEEPKAPRHRVLGVLIALAAIAWVHAKVTDRMTTLSTFRHSAPRPRAPQFVRKGLGLATLAWLLPLTVAASGNDLEPSPSPSSSPLPLPSPSPSPGVLLANVTALPPWTCEDVLGFVDLLGCTPGKRARTPASRGQHRAHQLLMFGPVSPRLLLRLGGFRLHQSRELGIHGGPARGHTG